MARNRGMLVLNIAHFFDHFVLLIFPTAVLAVQDEWPGGYADLLGLGTWTFAAFALATLPAGWLGDRWDRSSMMRLFWLGTGASCLVAAAAPGPGMLAFGLAAIGLFAAIYHPVATALVYGASARAGQALAINGVFGNMGVAAAALITGAVTEALGWRWAFALPGLGMLVLGLLLPPADGGVEERPRPAEVVAADRGTQRRVALVLATTALAGGLIFSGMTIALPKLLEERLAGWTSSLAAVGLIGASIFAISGFAQLPVGRLLDRLGPRRLILAIEAVKTPLLLLLALNAGSASALLALPLMLLVFGEIPITAWLLGRWVAPAWRSRAYAAQFVLSLGVGAGAVPLITTLFRYTGDSDALLWILAAASALVWATALLLPHGAADGVRLDGKEPANG